MLSFLVLFFSLTVSPGQKLARYGFEIFVRENFKWGECENLFSIPPQARSSLITRADQERGRRRRPRREEERSQLPVRVAPRHVREDDDGEDAGSWRIDIDFCISNESLVHKLDEYGGFLAHKFQMTVRHHDFIFPGFHNCSY